MITKQEMIEVLAIYFDPLYKLAGGLMALSIIYFSYVIVIKPFLKRRIR